ncbi:hypothetical protein [Corynebacterium variabile]|uniref:hypothetical protein n=1 Tax=Corynebacterium variabile TaxID=1727 RepID=UPI003A95D7CD
MTDSPLLLTGDTTAPDTTTGATPWATDYSEVCLLRALMYSRYADVLTMCSDRPVEALQADSRRLILTTLLQAAHAAVDAGHGQRAVSPAAVLARLSAMSGTVALDAVTTYLPEALAGEVRGAHATTPAVHEAPLIWDAVERAYLLREVESHGYALVAAAENGDPSILTAEVARGERLRALAARVGITTRPLIVTEGSTAA